MDIFTVAMVKKCVVAHNRTVGSSVVPSPPWLTITGAMVSACTIVQC